MANRDQGTLLREGLIKICNREDPVILEKMMDFMDRVLEKNKVMNLTAITDPEDFVVKHFLDSLSICRLPAFHRASNIIDVGTGAGFPGMPLAILYPEKQFLLMDSLNKRILFLEETCREMGLENVAVLHDRAEDLGRDEDYREQFDLCVSRAVAKLSVLSEYCLPLVKTGGFFIPYKTGMEDLTEGRNAVKILGGTLEEILEFPKLTGALSFVKLDHRLVCIKKTGPTPKKYPRKAGTPAKEPL